MCGLWLGVAFSHRCHQPVPHYLLCLWLWLSHRVRHEVAHFVTTLEENITSQVLDRCWHDFTQRMATESLDLPSVRREHDAYLRSVATRCLLDTTMPQVHSGCGAQGGWLCADVSCLVGAVCWCRVATPYKP